MRSVRRTRARVRPSRRDWSMATSRPATRRARATPDGRAPLRPATPRSRSRLVGRAFGLDLLLDLTPIAGCGPRFAEPALAGIFDDGSGFVDVLHEFQRELTFGGVVLGRPPQCHHRV